MKTSNTGLWVRTGAVLVLGFANLIADGISMGYGDFLSSTAEKEFSANQQLIADWEVENDIHGEMMELVSAYQEQGMEKEDADKVSVFQTYAICHVVLREVVLETRMGLELSILPFISTSCRLCMKASVYLQKKASRVALTF